MGNRDISIVKTLKEWVGERLNGINTSSVAIVEDVDADSRRVEVSLKSDPEVFIDNIPVVSPYVMDGAGMVFPIEIEMEGVLLHTKEELRSALAESGHTEGGSTRRFTLESAIFIGGFWLDDMEIPEHDEGEFLLQLLEGSNFRMQPDGRVVFEHPTDTEFEITADGVVRMQASGTLVELNPDGSYNVTHNSGSEFTFTEDGDVELTHPEGSSLTLSPTSIDAAFAGSELSVTEDGVAASNDSDSVIRLTPSGDILLGTAASASPVLTTDAVLEYEDTGDSEEGDSEPETKEVTIADPGSEHTEAS